MIRDSRAPVESSGVRWQVIWFALDQPSCNSTMYEYLRDNGMTRDEYQFFMHRSPKHHCIMGNDYYATNEHLVSPDGRTQPSGEIFGYNEITREYFQRYKLPVMHTETNYTEGADGTEAVACVFRRFSDSDPILVGQ